MNYRNNSSFSREYPMLQIAWDATSLGKLKTCPRKYFYELVQGWQTRKESVHLTFGKALHAALEIYDKERAKENDHKTAQRKTLTAALEWCGGYDENEVYRKWQSEDKYKGPYTLLRSILWYTELHKDDQAQTVILRDGTPAVELQFQFALPEFYAPDGNEYILCGHIDRIVDFCGQLWIMDRKTTKSTLYEGFFESFTPDNQMSMYSLAGHIVFQQDVKGVMVDGIQIAINFSEFMRGFAYRTNDMLEEWLADTKAWIKFAEHYAIEGRWPQNDSVCGLYGGCSYRSICGKDPAVRNAFLASNFRQRTWDPIAGGE